MITQDMARNPQGEDITAALDEVKNTITKFHSEFENLRLENEQLKDQIAIYERKLGENDRVREAGLRYRKHLKRLSRKFHTNPLETTGTFESPNDVRSWGPPVKYEQRETSWFEWIEKELQFAKEMREAFRRVHEQSVEANE